VCGTGNSQRWRFARSLPAKPDFRFMAQKICPYGAAYCRMRCWDDLVKYLESIQRPAEMMPARFTLRESGNAMRKGSLSYVWKYSAPILQFLYPTHITRSSLATNKAQLLPYLNMLSSMRACGNWGASMFPIDAGISSTAISNGGADRNNSAVAFDPAAVMLLRTPRLGILWSMKTQFPNYNSKQSRSFISLRDWRSFGMRFYAD